MKDLSQSPDSLRNFAHAAVDWMVDYLSGFGDEVIYRDDAPRESFERFDEPLPERGLGAAAVLEAFERDIVPRATHLQHPGNFAYIPNSTGVVGIVADLLASTLNQNVSLVRGGPSAAAIEARVVSWLQALLGYPSAEEGAGGVLASGGSIANLMGIALGRARVAGSSDARERGREALRVYVSDETHSSIDRAVRFLGVPSDAIRRVPTNDAFCMDPEALRVAVGEERGPGVVVATAGSIGSGAVDPLEAIAEVCRERGFWLHVDGAYGALAAAAPLNAWMRDGLAKADSLSLDPHKWLFVPIDTSCLLVRDVDFMRRFFTVVPEYLKVSSAEMEGGLHHPMEHTMELSRRFRALRLWMVLKTYGAAAFREAIEEHLALAARLASWIEASDDFELAAPVVTSTVCFCYRGASDDFHQELMNRIVKRPGLFLSRNRLRGRFTLRACITHLRTTEADVKRLWDACREEASKLAEEHSPR